MRSRALLGPCLLALAVLGLARPADQGALRAGQEALGPWWMRQTQLTPDGHFASLKTRRWWKKAAALQPGQSLVLDVGGEAKDRMLVRRETVTLHGQPVDTLIWVIDDDGDGSIQAGGDRHADCYIIDYGVDGIVDRMVDYVDTNGDGRAEEVDVRFFTDGVLSYAWFAVDVDRDGLLWPLTDFGDSLEACRTCQFEGDNVFYVNVFDPARGTWCPIGECPIATYDTDGDGASDIAVRIAAVPASWDPAKDPDFASAAYARPWDAGLADAVVAGLRVSYRVGRDAGKDGAAPYGMSFDLAGRTPYKFPDMVRAEPGRRPPQETVVIPWKQARALAETFEARETGFSWVESFDDATAPPGTSAGPLEPDRKGLAWPWERRPIEESGGPSRKWNVRREWSSKPSAKRQLYYSEIDKRVHLFGAEEGWLQVGNFAGLGPVAEVRTYDTDGDGFFDRWEVYLANSTRPVRVTQVRDEKAKLIEVGPAALGEFLEKEVLPGVKAENDRLLAAIDAVRPYEAPAELKAALAKGPAGYRRYAQDVLRELAYLNLRDYYATLAGQTLFRDERGNRPGDYWGDLGDRSAPRRPGTVPAWDSVKAWKLARLLEELDVAYGRGDYARAAELIGEVGKLDAGR